MNSMRIQINEIYVGKRFRNEFGDLNELAISINTYGLIQPIVITPYKGEETQFHWTLVAGERRLRAHQILKLEEIDAVLRDELSDLEKREIELEENLHRKAFDWIEEIEIKKEIDALKRLQHGEGEGRSKGNWTITDTANFVGQSKSTVAADIELAKALEFFPDLKKEPNKKAAYKKLKTKLEEQLRAEIAKRQKAKGSLAKVTDKIIHGDCIQALDTIKPASVHLVVVDPPYGIDYTDLIDADNSAGYVEFADDKAGSIDMIDIMLTKLNNVMATNSSIYMFCSITHYSEMRKLMERYFSVDPMPLIWYKQNLGGGRVTIPDVYQCRSYEVMLYGRKGNRSLIKQGQPNVLPFDVVPPRQKLHPTEKPTALLRELISRSSVEGETVLDCCAGSGSTLIASKSINRDYIGIEENEHYYNVICQRLTAKGVELESKPQPGTVVNPAPTDVPEDTPNRQELIDELTALLGEE